jgi:hypothetical protein
MLKLPIPELRKANESFSYCELKVFDGPADAGPFGVDWKAASAARLSKGPAECELGVGPPKWVLSDG